MIVLSEFLTREYLFLSSSVPDVSSMICAKTFLVPNEWVIRYRNDTPSHTSSSLKTLSFKSLSTASLSFSFLKAVAKNLAEPSGSSPAEAYFVEIGPQTMSREDILNGRLICNIGIAPSRPAEFVVFRVTQHTAEAEGAVEETAEA